ncbi:MAG: PspC domain-containing protein [Prevotella sp.]|jgi:phage shock protein PspC (stress-responsive transcriptional regulator)
MEKKRLYRSADRMLGGVCGGIAEYFDVDPTIVRILYVVLTFGTAFSGILVYLLLWLIVPERH